MLLCNDVLTYMFSFINGDDISTQIAINKTCKVWYEASNNLRLKGLHWTIINEASVKKVLNALFETKKRRAILKVKMTMTRFIPGFEYFFGVYSETLHIAASLFDMSWLSYSRVTFVKIYGLNGGYTKLYNDKPINDRSFGPSITYLNVKLDNVDYFDDKLLHMCNIKTLIVNINDNIDISLIRVRSKSLRKLCIAANNVFGYMPSINDVENLALISKSDTPNYLLCNTFMPKYLKSLTLAGIKDTNWKHLTNIRGERIVINRIKKKRKDKQLMIS
jgi:hypothetical protein